MLFYDCTDGKCPVLWGWSNWILGVGRRMSVVNWSGIIDESLDDRGPCARQRCPDRGALLRLRRDLHDQVGSALVGVGMQVEAAQRLIDSDPDEARRLLEDVRSETSLLVQQIRGIASRRGGGGGDMPAGAAQGVGSALRTMIGRMNHVVGDRVRIVAEIDPAADRLRGEDHQAGAAVFWIVREALANMLKHSRAGFCTVVVTVRGGELRARVEDDGVGFPAQRSSDGSGLRNMVERALEREGWCRVGPRVPRGFVVNAAVPLTAHRS
jgi:signal transduction histidine kinase